MSRVQSIAVGADEAEQRVDRWLRRRFPQLGQGRIEKMCRRGEVRVDGARVKAASRVSPGQIVRVPPMPDLVKSSGEPHNVPRPVESPAIDDAAAAEIQASVLFRDDEMIVLNKRAGLAVQGGSGMVRHLGQLLPALRFGRSDDPRLVHRLDKDTSGLLVLARTGAAAARLSRAFRSRAVTKTYFAAVAGRPALPRGTIRFGLRKAGRAGEGELMRCVHPDDIASTDGAVTATTDYAVIEQNGNRLAWVALRPVTGRTHQLRAHMAEIGCPIAGDGKYGGRSQSNDGDGWGAGLGGAISRKLHLHAARLSIPGKSGTLELSAPLPEHMQRTWDLLGWRLEDAPVDPFDRANLTPY